MSEPETLYDQAVRNLKNNKLAVVLLLAFAGVLGAAKFQGALSTVIGAVRSPRIQLQASIQPFDFMAEDPTSAKNFRLLSDDRKHLDRLAAALAAQVVTAVGVTTDPIEANLNLNGTTLASSQPLRASVLVLESSMAQVARVPRDVGDANGLDLLPLFADPSFLNTGDNSVDMELVPRDGFFERQPLKVYKRDQGQFSFESSRSQTTQRISFKPRKPTIMLADITATNDTLRDASASVQFMLRSELEKNQSLKLSSITETQLKEEKNKIQHLPMGGAKSALANKFNIDYIVRGTLLAD